MNFAQILSIYITLNILIAFGFIALSIFKQICLKFKINISASSELQFHYFILGTLLFFILIQTLFPHQEFFQPAVKLWTTESFETLTNYTSVFEKNTHINFSNKRNPSIINESFATTTVLTIFISLMIIGFIKSLKDMLNLLRFKNQSYIIKKFGRVYILAHDTLTVPFSFWYFGRAYVIIPSHFITQYKVYKISILHELQHHRQHDTIWVYVFWYLRFVCIVNPFIHLWNRWISEIQEFACDETLVNKNKVSLCAYARCLINVVETAQVKGNQKNFPGCATGLAFLIKGNLIKRRIENMIDKKSIHSGKNIRIFSGTLIAGFMAISAFASQNIVQDKQINLAQAKHMAELAQSSTEFPIVVNDLVLKQLNKYIGTREGREFMRNSLQRMESYRTIVSSKLNQYHLPEELMAIPIVESGFQNLEQVNPHPGAGIWQFIQSTARNFGLRVDATIDERLNADLLTDAAMRLLLSDKLRFNDWQLALLAFNAGETKVQQGVDKVGSKDVWSLIRSGYEGDKDYVAKVMAAILIMKNPSSVQ